MKKESLDRDELNEKVITESVEFSPQQSCFVKIKGYAKNEEFDSKLIIFVLHDLFDYHKRYEFLPELISNRKIAFVWLDVPGFGMSSGERKYIEDFDQHTHALHSVISYTKKKYFSNNVAQEKGYLICAQGFGGLLALRYHQVYRDHFDFKLNGMILVNPLIGASGPSSWWERIFKIADRSPWSHFKWSMALDMDKLIESDSEKEKIYQDMLNTDIVTVGLYQEIIRVSKDVQETAYFIDFPILMICSDQSQLASQDVLRVFSRGVESQYLKYVEYANCSHDLFHSKRQADIIMQINDWLMKNFLK